MLHIWLKSQHSVVFQRAWFRWELYWNDFVGVGGVKEKDSGISVSSTGRRYAQPAHTDTLFLTVIHNRNLNQALERLPPCP